MKQQQRIVVFWWRRDLRIEDNAALYHALNSGLPVLPIFIFDKNILQELPPNDRRISFIYKHLERLQNSLLMAKSSLLTFHDTPLEAFKKLLSNYSIEAVYCNEDYEPYARLRDLQIEQCLQQHGVSFYSYKDQVIFEKGEVVKADGKPYTIYTPYAARWRTLLSERPYATYPSQALTQNFFTIEVAFPSLSTIGFVEVKIDSLDPIIDTELIGNYSNTRNLPYLKGTSQLGVHLRFGTLSIRKVVSNALACNDTFLSELIWREFFMQILYHFPTVVHECFRPAYNHIQWQNDDRLFDLWCVGKTGYPLVDAGMRELMATGFMHNRVRMVCASFLCKHLLTDWRRGEAYFAQLLMDYDLAANNGNWQWAAGTGCDAAPYFRVFNPTAQQEKFDPDFVYIKKWVPEFGTTQYPKPIVAHDQARQRAIAHYKVALAAAAIK